MDELKWIPFLYNGLETNIDITKCAKVRRVKRNWFEESNKNYKYGEIDFDKLKLHTNGYRNISVKIKGLKNTNTLLVHQLIASTFLNYKFNGFNSVVNHIDGNKLNNNLCNLEVITHRENLSKERTKKSGLPVGVSFSKQYKKYVSQIRVNGKIVFLGRFTDINQAANAYQLKLKQL
jgi:hypothetical protein